jgi:hypothetical protein
MQIERARLLAERLHANDYEEDGTALLEHIRRVARRVDVDVQVCLHPRVRADGWSPPYARGLALLIGHNAGRATAAQAITSAQARSTVCRPDLLQDAAREVLLAQMDRRAGAR